MAFYPLGLLLITFDDNISQGFADRSVASICGSLSLFLLNQNIFCSCPFGLDVGYLIALCLCYSTVIYFPGILPLTLRKGIEMLRGQESVKEEYWKVLSTGEHLKVLLLVVVYLLFLLFLFHPLLLLFKFLQLLWVIIHLLRFYNARKNEMWAWCGISNQCSQSWPSHFVSKHKKWPVFQTI